MLSSKQSRDRPKSENIYEIAPPLLDSSEDDPEPINENLYEIVGEHD